MILLFIVLFITYLISFQVVKYGELTDENECIYEYIFGERKISFICTVIPVIPEIIFFPAWIILGIIRLGVYLHEYISIAWENYTRRLK